MPATRNTLAGRAEPSLLPHPAGPLFRPLRGKENHPAGYGPAPFLTDPAAFLHLEPITADDRHKASPESTAKAADDIRTFTGTKKPKAGDADTATLDSLGDLICEIERKSDGLFNVTLDPKTGEIAVTHRITGPNCIYIFLRGTSTWRDETALLIKRVIRAFDERYKIGTILDTWEYEVMLDEEECYRTDATDETEEQIKERFAYLATYKEGGTDFVLLNEYDNLPPATPADVAAFVPANQDEERLKELLEEGIALAEDTNPEHEIWKHREFLEEDQQPGDGFVGAYDTIFITTERDEMHEQYCNGLDNRFNSGEEMESIAYETDISHPENNDGLRWLIRAMNWLEAISHLLDT